MDLSYETLYNSVMAFSADGIVIADLEGRVVKASDSALRIMGLEGEQAAGFCFVELIAPKDKEQAFDDLRDRIKGNNVGEPVCYNAVRANGDSFYLEVNVAPVVDSQNNQTGLVMVFRDITIRKLQERELAKTNRKLAVLSVTDALTGIANRRYFEDMLKSEYSRHVRFGKKLTVILADIDHFKDYNDYYGHVNGDTCLCRIAQVLNEGIFRSYDLAARYGGEEFALILPDTDLKGALLVAERIRHSIMSLAIPHERSSTASIVTASFGVASSCCVADGDPFTIVAEADKMLYHAKSRGRNQVVSDQNEPAWKDKVENLIPLVWKDEYRSGDSIIDSEHQALFSSVNSLLETSVSGMKLEVHAENLLDEIMVHFRNEERLLYTVHYPDIANHIKEHMKLLRISRSLVTQYKDRHLSIGDLFSFFAYELIEQHLICIDKLYFPYISTQESL